MCNQAHADLPGSPDAPGHARQLAREWLAAWGVTDRDGAWPTGQDGVLALSELVSNAVKYAPGRIEFRLETHRDLIRVSVTDTSPDPVRQRVPTADDPGGRGIPLLDRMGAWGQERQDNGSKLVWCELPVTASEALALGCSQSSF